MNTLDLTRRHFGSFIAQIFVTHPPLPHNTHALSSPPSPLLLFHCRTAYFSYPFWGLVLTQILWRSHTQIEPFTDHRNKEWKDPLRSEDSPRDTEPLKTRFTQQNFCGSADSQTTQWYWEGKRKGVTALHLGNALLTLGLNDLIVKVLGGKEDTPSFNVFSTTYGWKFESPVMASSFYIHETSSLNFFWPVNKSRLEIFENRWRRIVYFHEWPPTKKDTAPLQVKKMMKVG